MHGACMATKTISIDLRAWERLRQARQSDAESFSKVIHRAIWPKGRQTCGDLLDDLARRGRYLPAREIRRLEKAQKEDAPPPARWS